MTIAIIGAGIAGLSAAQILKAGRQGVVLFDKGRGPGGRMSSRRSESALGELVFDHGAQYFTARSPAFQAQVEQWQDAGHAAPWTARQVEIDAGGRVTPSPSRFPRYVGTPGMNGVIRAMAQGLDVTWGREVATIRQASDGWTLGFSGEAAPMHASRLILAVPVEQARHLLAGAGLGARFAGLEPVRSDPCWAVMLAFEAQIRRDFDAARLEGSPLSWAARNRSKPSRTGPDTWVLHASPNWSQANLELAPQEVCARLTDVFTQIAGASGAMKTPAFAAAHRWRYAQVGNPLTQDMIWDDQLRLGLCGDYFNVSRIEAAWISGRAVAEAILAG